MDPRIVLLGLGTLGLLGLVRTIRRALRPRRHHRGPNAHHNVDGSSKRSYRSRRSALRAAQEYEHDFGDRMNAYRCVRGRHWHIGHVR